MKVRLIMFGRTSRPQVRALLDDYMARIQRYVPIEITELRETSDAALRKLKLPSGPVMVLLDDKGTKFTSAQFAKWLCSLRDGGVREVIFFCGAAEGFPDELRQRATQSVSLSSLTLSHELARVLLVEQIYRAFTILAGHPYAK